MLVGKTIAVMGTGFNHVFPEENKDIYNRILSEGGLILTEYEDNIGFVSKNFPERNRIVSRAFKRSTCCGSRFYKWYKYYC